MMNKVDMRTPAELTALLTTELRRFFAGSGFTRAVLGLSGGIDSAVVFALAVNALGGDNVLPVLLPSEFTSQQSVDDALAMTKNLHTDFKIIKIGHLYDEVNATLKPVFGDAPFDVTEENIQARLRGLLLMAIANKQKRLLLNTSNKSELSVGYGTLYGDLCGSLSVIGNVYKTDVYKLAHHINANGEIIPANIINRPPSAELHPDQKDSDSLPDYSVLDPILALLVDQQLDIPAIVAAGHDEAVVVRVADLVRRARFKKSQLPPRITL